jgi:diamine N-acetyltransferase
MTASPWTLRPALAADAPALAAFGAQTFLATFGHLYPPDDKAAFIEERYSLERTCQDITAPGRRIELAFAGDALVGFSDAGAVSLPVEALETGALELHRLYLADAARGTGLADALMAGVFDWARAHAAPALYLGVFHANDRAQAFYRRHGFEIVGSYWFKVGATLDDERIMRCALPAGRG